jgi:electron transfer flavoprotein beta subunit
VTQLEWEPGAATARVHRELEGGLVDVTEVDVPALLTIQTGINERRYATLRAIKQAEQKEIAVVEPAAPGEPAYRVRRMSVPQKGEGAEPLDGSPADIARRVAEIVRERMSA